MDKKATDIVAYITWIGWIIAFVAGDREASKLHLNQALVINIVSLICSLLARVPIVNIVAGIVSLVVFVFWIMGLVGACSGSEKELPLVGQIKIIK